ncbi:flagellar hook-basal body complex protein [Paracoccus aminophilus]|uniref:Flagellar basal-body rod protein FlgF n=1 Tax=Paracoccus aminophilus JCM 7686 TaxID=1367847 RepID=S5YF91_PARAH|nr:flagellar hook-basal body complex protein [Paracoccus aminophilus]AGT10128.1 flagellar basal-body rod protein FlgF [Paracoccus aminophilus JCM 7686]
MDNAIYAALTRQSGLMREMRTVANNIANANTTGFRREGVVFSEYMVSLNRGGETLAMANARGRMIDLRPGGLTQTGGTLDLALEGDGFFMVQTPQGNRLTRAGAFALSPNGEIVDMAGNQLLDDGAAPIAIPDGTKNIGIGSDGTVSADDQPVGRVGLFATPDPSLLQHEAGTLFDPGPNPQPLEDARVRQGFIEESNVDPVLEISRMIEVQRAYELGQSFLENEDQRIRNVIVSLTR